MRNITLLLICVFASLVTAKAQNYEIEYVAGLNMSSLAGETTNLQTRHQRTGYYFGVQANMPMTLSDNITFGILYSQQGAFYTYTYFDKGNQVDNITHHNIDYVHFPVVWRRYFGSFFSELGVYNAFVFQIEAPWETITYMPSQTTVDSSCYTAYLSTINGLDFGAIFGLGSKIDIIDGYNITLNVRYKPGLVRINKTADFQTNKIRNQVFTFTVGISQKESKYGKFRRRRR